MQWLTHDDFAGRVGEHFTCADGQVLVLLEASVGPDGSERRQFTLVLGGPDGLGQGTRDLVHDELGTLAVFLVPIAPGRYEAVFG